MLVNYSELIKTLKGLTEEQTLVIVKTIQPFIELTKIESSYQWDGFDFVGSEKINGIYRHIVQIDWSIRPQPLYLRFRYYVDLYEYPVNDEQLKTILTYLTEINPRIKN